MSYQYNNQVLNAILADLGGTTTYPYDIDALNAIIGQLGGTGGHYYLIDAYNELCGIQSVTAGHKYLIDALNAINVAGGGTSEQFELPALVQLGAQFNYNQPWTNVPYFALPENGVTLIAGKTVTLYGDTLVTLPVPVPDSYKVTYTCAIGTQSGNNLVLTTPAVGTYSCLVNIKNGTKLIDEYSFNINIQALAPQKAVKLLCIGDSIMHNGLLFHWYPNAIAETLPNNTFSYIGTKGTTYKHEGIDGWQWVYFVTPGSPFFKAGVLDIAAYFADNSFSVPDFIVIQLAVNELMQNSATYDHDLTDADITNIINNAKTLLSAFLSYNAKVKVILQLPTLTGVTKTAWDLLYDGLINQNLYIENVHKYWQAFVTAFANGVYNARVTCGYSPMFMNRGTGYDDTPNAGIHPIAAGGNEIGIGIAMDINKGINSLYGAELVNQALYKVNPLSTFWTVIMDGFSSDGEKIIINTGWGLLGFSPFTVGKSYRVEVDIIRIAGTLYLSDNSSINIELPATTGKSVNTFTAINNTAFYLLSFAFNGTVSYLSIKEIL